MPVVIVMQQHERAQLRQFRHVGHLTDDAVAETFVDFDQRVELVVPQRDEKTIPKPRPRPMMNACVSIVFAWV